MSKTVEIFEVILNLVVTNSDVPPWTWYRFISLKLVIARDDVPSKARSLKNNTRETDAARRVARFCRGAFKCEGLQTKTITHFQQYDPTAGTKFMGDSGEICPPQLLDRGGHNIFGPPNIL